MNILANLWLIPAFPLFAALIGALLKRPQRKSAAAVAIGAMTLSFVLATIAFAHLLFHPQRLYLNFPWMQFGSEWIKLGWILDPLSAIMLVMVTFVGLLIFIYSTAYMHHDENFTRFLLLPLALRRSHAGPAHRQQPASALHVLGSGRTHLLPLDRLLV